MRMAIKAVIVLLALAVTAAAQDFERQRDEGRRGPGRRGRGPSISRLIERLGEQIEFDEDQASQIEEIVAAHEKRMREFRAQREEVRAAMEAGDEERAAELREQLRQQRGERGRPFQAVIDEIEPLLHEDQAEGFRQFREELSQRRDPGGMRGMRQMVREFPDAMNMTEEQRTAFEEVLAGRRERMRERRQQREEGNLGDATRPGPPDFEAIRDELFREVAEILDENQLELLAEYWVPLDTGTGVQEQPNAVDFRIVLLAAKRIRNLNRDQREAWRTVTREAMQSSRGLRRSDECGKARLTADVQRRILEMLDKQQRSEFERNLERLKSQQERSRDSRRARRAETPRRAP